MTESVTDRLAYSEVLLEKRRMRLVHAIDPRIGALTRGSLKLDEMRDREFDRMLYRLEADILAEKLVDKTVTKKAYHRVDVPSSWWQHFKDEVLDRSRLTQWFVRWRPVRFTTHEYEESLVASFQQYATFPAVDIQTPPGVHHHFIVPKEELSYS